MKTHEKIRLLREQHQWTQEEMATKMSMSTQGYAKIERGETRSNLPRLEQISEIFNMDICELLSYGDEGKLSFSNSDNNFTNLHNFNLAIGGDQHSQSEIHKLQLIISHKDEIIQYKNEIIENQKQELELLKEMNNLLKSK